MENDLFITSFIAHFKHLKSKYVLSNEKRLDKYAEDVVYKATYTKTLKELRHVLNRNSNFRFKEHRAVYSIADVVLNSLQRRFKDDF